MCFWLCEYFIPELHQTPQWDVWLARAALQSSSCHLWAAGRSGTVSQLSAPPAQTHARLFDACSCLSHPGENHLDRNTMKSLYLTLWQLFNRTVIYCSLLFFHILFTSCQLVQCCLQTLLCWIYAINMCYYVAPNWKLGQHLLSLSLSDNLTCWTQNCLNIWCKSFKSLNTKW